MVGQSLQGGSALLKVGQLSSRWVFYYSDLDFQVDLALNGDLEISWVVKTANMIHSNDQSTNMGLGPYTKYVSGVKNCLFFN